MPDERYGRRRCRPALISLPLDIDLVAVAIAVAVDEAGAGGFLNRWILSSYEPFLAFGDDSFFRCVAFDGLGKSMLGSKTLVCVLVPSPDEEDLGLPVLVDIDEILSLVTGASAVC